MAIKFARARITVFLGFVEYAPMQIAFEILLGLFLLILGAEWLVRGSSQLAFALGVPALIVGLTVVAFGTSAPELAVSIKAAYAGEASVALGNVFGSNIANMLLVLGLSATVAPLAVSPQIIRIDMPILIAVSGLSWLLAFDRAYQRFDGVVLILLLVGYICLQLYIARKQFRSGKDDTTNLSGDNELPTLQIAVDEPQKSNIPLAIVGCIAGLAMLVFGSDWLVSGAISLATNLGVSPAIIGLTVVAVGTSMPEIVTSCVAAYRGERELAIGNVVGSNLFNLLAVLGISCTVAPQVIPVADQFLKLDIPLMLVVTAVCYPIFLTGRLVSRREGIVMLSVYVIYVAYGIVTSNVN